MLKKVLTWTLALLPWVIAVPYGVYVLWCISQNRSPLR